MAAFASQLARCLAFHSRGASCKAADGEAGPRSAVARPTWRSSPHRQSGRARFRQFSVGPLLCRQPPGLDGVATQSDSSVRGCQPRARAPALSFGGLSARTRAGCRPPVAPQTPTAAVWAPPPLPAAPSDRAPPPPQASASTPSAVADWDPTARRPATASAACQERRRRRLPRSPCAHDPPVCAFVLDATPTPLSSPLCLHGRLDRRPRRCARHARARARA